MKNILFTLFILASFLSACGDKGSASGGGNDSDSTQHPDADTTPKAVVDEPKAAGPAERFAGNYLSDPYLTQLEKSGSPFELAEFEFPGSYWGLSLDKATLESEDSRFDAYWLHEGGGGGAIAYDEGCDCYKRSDRPGGYTSIEGPYTLTLDGEDMLLLTIGGRDPEKYRKVPDHQSAIRKILFVGEYTDKLSGKKVVMNEDGSMTGVDGWNYYEIGYDFVGIIQNEYVWFQKSADDYKDRKYYHWNRNDNGMLMIYEIDGEFPEERIGKAILELQPAK